MQSSDIIKPTPQQTPFAINGDKDIPNQTATGTDTSSIDLGFLPITQEPISEGGLPPERIDFNGMFYLATDQRVFLQNGGFITYDDDVAAKIGGYPKGAILGYLDSSGNFDFVISMVENNQNTNFNTNPSYINGTYWKFCNSNKVNKSRTISLTGAVTGSKNFNLATDTNISVPTTLSGYIASTKTVSLTGAVTGSSTINLASSNTLSIATTGKSKTVSLTGAVTGSATLNTGNTDTVSITTTGKSKTVSLTGAVTGSATLDTGNANAVSIATTYDSIVTGNKTLNLTGAVTGSSVFNLANSTIDLTTTANTVANVNLSNLTSTGENHFANTALTNLTSGLSNTICTTAPTTVSSATSAAPAVVIENYVNGTSWYRVWSDGYCEQGDKFDANKNTTIEITLLKEYKNANYTINATYYTYNSTGNPVAIAIINDRTASDSFVIYNSLWSYADRGGYWLTQGYLR